MSGTSPAVGGPNRVTYTVEIEDGVQLVGGPETFATDVSTILADPRGWTGDKQHGFQRVDSRKPDLRIRLTSQMTTRDVCGFAIPFEGSCVNGDNVTINVARWVRGAVSFQGALVEYKQYVVNHEVGHGLGYDHKSCPAESVEPVVEHDDQFGVVVPAVLRVLHDQRRVEAAVELYTRVRVEPVRSGVWRGELVGEGTAGQDLALGEVRHAVHVVAQREAVPVDARRPR